MLNKKIASRYLVANLAIDKNYHITEEAEVTLEPLMAELLSFKNYPVNGQSLQTFAWFVSSLPRIKTFLNRTLIQKVDEASKLVSFYQGEQGERLEDNPSYKKEKQEQHLRDLFWKYNEVSGYFSQEAHAYVIKHFKTLDSLSAFHFKDAQNLKDAFSDLVTLFKFFDTVSEALMKITDVLAEAITDRNAELAAREIESQSGVGGWVRNMFRKASFTLKGQLLEPLQGLKGNLNAFGLSKMNPKAIDAAVDSFHHLAACDVTYLKIEYKASKLSKEDEPLKNFIRANSEFFQHLKNDKMNLLEVGVETSTISMVQKRAKFVFDNFGEVRVNWLRPISDYIGNIYGRIRA